MAFSLHTLIEQPEKWQSLARRAYEAATRQFNRTYGEQIWSELIHSNGLNETEQKRVLVINVFFCAAKCWRCDTGSTRLCSRHA